MQAVCSEPSFAPLPDTCLVDEMLRIRVQGLQRGDRVRLSLASVGAPGTMWRSEALYAAEGDELDLARAAPVSGGYQGVDAMGLFWSRAPVPSVAGEVDSDPMTMTLAGLVEGGGPLRPHRIQRRFAREGVRRTEVREGGLVATLFEPEAPGPHPTVLVVGGSGGGLYWSAEAAALLASHGFVALAVAYFGLPGLPANLDRIPLEYFGDALQWLEGRSSVAARRIAVVGVSRGGELALLLGSTFADLRAVVAYVPSGVLWGAYPSTGHSAWTWQGRELPFVADVEPDPWARLLARKGVHDATLAAYDLCLRDPAVADAACIPVERINGPVLLVTAQADGLWPCERLTAYAIERLRRSGFAHRVEHLSYAGAGHGISWPNVPVTVTRFKHPVSGDEVDLGGSPAATALASRDSWPRMLAFLHESLAP